MLVYNLLAVNLLSVWSFMRKCNSSVEACNSVCRYSVAPIIVLGLGTLFLLFLLLFYQTVIESFVRDYLRDLHETVQCKHC